MHNEEDDVRALIDLAQSFESAGKLETSINLMREAEVLFHESGDLANEVKCLQKLASLLFDIGRITESWNYYERIIEESSRLKNPALQADSLRWIAFLSIKVGRPHDGIKYAEEALEICVQNDLLEESADIFAVFGNIHFEIGDFQKALHYFDEA